MIGTNLVLNTALSLIMNFADVVGIDQGDVPRKFEDAQKWAVSPVIADSVLVANKSGAIFSVDRGVVDGYDGTGSYFGLQDTRLLYRFTGDAHLNTNDAVKLAREVLERLVKCGGSPLRESPRLRSAGSLWRKPIPSVKIAWPNPFDPLRASDSANIEIDLRTGTIVAINLYATNFFDPPREGTREASRVTKDPDGISGKRVVPYPTTNQITRAVAHWLILCRELKMNPGDCTNVSQVDWERSVVYTNVHVSRTVPVCQIRFTNNACIESLDGVVFSIFCSDACYTGFWMHRPAEEWKQFEGPILLKWQDLADRLDPVLSRALNLPLATFTDCQKFPRLDGVTRRSVIRWLPRILPADYVDFYDPYDVGELLEAEFDLQTGDVKWIYFHDPALIEALKRTAR